VLLLHGFPQTSDTWRAQLPAIAAAGGFAVAPNQRGYSRHARPQGVAAYQTQLLVRDALMIAEALGYAQFDLVGHDWGGQLAWLIAALHSSRVRTLTVLSRPHPAAFAWAMKSDTAQSERSKHHRAFQDPGVAGRLLKDGARELKASLHAQGVVESDADRYLARLDNEEALDAALNWYRAAGRVGSALVGENVPAVEVPTRYLWGDADAAVGRAAAEATARFVTAPYRFQVLPGVGHFITDQAPAAVTDALLAHISDAR